MQIHLRNKRTKATSSSKKSDKGAPTTVPFTDAAIIKNYRSTNLATNKGKILNNNQSEMTQKRYQYHKRIRSETGNTVITPLEQMSEKYGKMLGGMTGVPTITKATTDITSPAIPSEDHRFSMNDKSNSNPASTINTVQLSKYEFAPSFTHHKNISLDQNAQYRKFTTNKNPTNSHKIDISKIKMSQKNKQQEDVKKSEIRSSTQIKTHSPTKNINKSENKQHALNQSPAMIEFKNESRDKYVREIDNNHNLLDDDSFSEYQFNRGLNMPEPQSKIETKKNLQLDGDHTISISKETDELAFLTHSKQESSEPKQVSNKAAKHKQSDKLK